MLDRRQWLGVSAAGMVAMGGERTARAAEPAKGSHGSLKITGLKVTPIALPDPPILAAGGCHGPYFLRNIVQLETDAGIVGLGETKGGQDRTSGLERARGIIVGQDAFAYRSFAARLMDLSAACCGGIELACLAACGKAAGRRLCELLGGSVRE